MTDGGERMDRLSRNRDKINACRRHHFPEPIPGIEQGVGAMFGGKMTCTHCGGELSLLAINEYVRGYEAAGGNGNDIIPGWRHEQPKRRYFGQPPNSDT